MDDVMGKTVTDKITGFKGVVTGHCRYISGCDQLLVTPKVKGDTVVESKWIDQQRCEVDKSAKRVVLDNGTTPGCDVPAPIR